MSDGWIKLHRKLLDNPTLDDDFNFRLFVREILLKVTHKPHLIVRGGKELTLQPGQMCFSIRALARQLGVKEKKIRDRLVTFRLRSMIVTQNDALGVILTVCNWSVYQNLIENDDAPNDALTTHQRRTNDAHNKNIRTEEQENPVPSGLVETAPPNSTSARPHKAIAEKMIQVFNRHLGDTLQRARVTKRRVRTLSIALKDDFNDDGRQWSAFCQRVAASDFLTGRKTEWRASLDWITKPANRIKILEGNYDNRAGPLTRHDREREEFIARFEHEILEQHETSGGDTGALQPANGSDGVGESFESDGEGETADRGGGGGWDLLEI